MPSGRPGGYPYPNGLTTVADVDTYLRTKLYPALISNDSRGEYFRDRKPPTDLTDLIVRPEWYGAKGDGTTDDATGLQAAITAAGESGRIVFRDVTYCTSVPLKYYSGQSWIGSGGIDVTGSGTVIKLTAAGTSVAEPYDTANTNYGVYMYGIYFNGQGYADAGLSLYNTSYALIDQCAAGTSKDNAAAFLLDSDTSKQCYFNKLNQPRGFASGTGGACIRFTRGANVNQVFGGKCGSSYRGMEFLTLSSGNVITGTDFETNANCHIYLDSTQNVFIGVHMEDAPIGYNITANGGWTTTIGTTFATSVTTQVSDSAKHHTFLETRHDASGEIGALTFGSSKMLNSHYAAASTLWYDMNLSASTSNAIIRMFLNMTGTGNRQIIVYKGDGTSTIVLQVDTDTESVYVKGPVYTTDIGPNTSDAADSSSIEIHGGGSAGVTRGGFIECYGNEHAVDVNKGCIDIVAGSGDGGSNKGAIKFWVDQAGVGTRVATITPDGYLGIGTTSPDYPLTLGASLGAKINLYDGQNWGIGLQGSLVEFINHSNAGDWAFGYGTSGSLTRVLTIDGAQGLGLGTQTFGTSATKTISIGTGTAPSTSPADAFQLYSADQAAGNAAPHFRTEAGDVVKLYKQVLAADLKVNYTTGELDSEAEVIAAVNATNTKINALITALQNTGLLASS